MDIFEESAKEFNKSLAVRLRPNNLDEFIGQEHLVGKDRPLRKIISKGLPVSVILYGPPGTGKTTVGNIIAKNLDAEIETLNAVVARIEDIRTIRERAKERIDLYRKRTIVFIDEIHRFNKKQQDALLPDVENNLYTIFGVTTLNPAFYVIPPLISRCLVFRLEQLTKEDIKKILVRALTIEKKEEFYKNKDEVFEFINDFCGGDARIALNIMEISLSFQLDTVEKIKENIPDRIVRYDRDGDFHYDIISAFIKSLRGSDPDGALYWLARMLKGGEDPRFITRRMMIFASEDIGNADPRAMYIALSAAQASEIVGLPEARIILAHAVTYLATAPKSNASYMGIEKAIEYVEKNEESVPEHLRTGDFFGKRGKDYEYPHNFDGHFVKQEYKKNKEVFYIPGDLGYEKIIKERLDGWKKKKDQ